MISCKHLCFTILFAAMWSVSFVVAAENSEGFRAVLESSELGPEALAEISAGPEYTSVDWKILLQIFSRLQQFHDLQPTTEPINAIPARWQAGDKHDIGELFQLRGIMVSVEEVSLPEKFADVTDWPGIYRCKFQFTAEEVSSFATVLTTRIPNSWQARQELSEPVRIHGVLIQLQRVGTSSLPVLLTHHISWYPTQGAPSGKLLLARAEMDVALLDEVRHRKPFVKPNVSREGEAFYAALRAMQHTSLNEIANLSAESVANVARRWRANQPELIRMHQELETKLPSSSDESTRAEIQQQIKQAKQQRGLAAAILSKAESGQSSVAPMFLQPDQEVGQLYLIEGIARRAVRIAVDDQPELDAYYELEVFTSDSQNLPIVCCLSQLPEGFPTGDKIREPVRLCGVFFKSWRYRSRDVKVTAGETARQRQLYTPVVVGKQPTWLGTETARDNRWALWGGVAFLGVLAALWISLTWLAQRDRRARAELRKPETINL